MKPPLVVVFRRAGGSRVLDTTRAHLGSAPPSRERVKYTPYPVNISHRTYNRPLDREYSKRRWQLSTRGSTRRPAHSSLADRMTDENTALAPHRGAQQGRRLYVLNTVSAWVCATLACRACCYARIRPYLPMGQSSAPLSG